MRVVAVLASLCILAFAPPVVAGDFDFKAPSSPPAAPAAKKAPARSRPPVKKAPKPADAAPAAAAGEAKPAAAAAPVASVTPVSYPPEAPVKSAATPVEAAPAPEAAKSAEPAKPATPEAAPRAALASAEPPAALVATAVPPAASAPAAVTPVVAASSAPVAAATPAAAISLPGFGGKAGSPAPPSVAWNGSMRFRYEARSVLDYRLPGALKRPATQRLEEAGDVSLMRLRLGANVKFSPLVRGEFVVQDARVMGVEGSPGAAIANMDLFYAFVDVDSIGRAPLSARIGRQVLEYGDGNVVAGSGWGNPGRGWDGLRLRLAPKGWQVDGFATWVMEGRVEGNDRMFSGADILWKGSPVVEIEGYAFARSFGDTSFTSERGGPKGSLADLTSGARLRWKRGTTEVKLEGAVQSGQRAGDRVDARFGTARASHEFKGAKKPKLAFEANWASADPNAADGVANRYDPIYWGNHGVQGTLDIFGRANALDVAAQGSVQWSKALNLLAELHRFQLVDARDSWFDDSGTALRRDAAGASGRDVGMEADLTVRWDARPGVGVLGGLSHFTPGAFVKNTGGAPQLNWVFTQMTVAF